jgi:hypothetical protein
MISRYLDGRSLVSIGMRYCAELGNEKSQHSQGCDAKFDAMRPSEQGQPLMEERRNASTVRVNREPSRRLAVNPSTDIL